MLWKWTPYLNANISYIFAFFAAVYGGLARVLLLRMWLNLLLFRVSLNTLLYFIPKQKLLCRCHIFWTISNPCYAVCFTTDVGIAIKFIDKKTKETNRVPKMRLMCVFLALCFLLMISYRKNFAWICKNKWKNNEFSLWAARKFYVCLQMWIFNLSGKECSSVAEDMNELFFFVAYNIYISSGKYTVWWRANFDVGKRQKVVVKIL
jgi:hypothetical protein